MRSGPTHLPHCTLYYAAGRRAPQARQLRRLAARARLRPTLPIISKRGGLSRAARSESPVGPTVPQRLRIVMARVPSPVGCRRTGLVPSMPDRTRDSAAAEGLANWQGRSSFA